MMVAPRRRQRLLGKVRCLFYDVPYQIVPWELGRRSLFADRNLHSPLRMFGHQTKAQMPFADALLAPYDDNSAKPLRQLFNFIIEACQLSFSNVL